MREIKFRALWPSGFEYFDMDKTWTPEQLISYNEAQIYSRQFMQFTGLLDKNGTEIYEGDIVSLRGATRGPQQGVVIFSTKATKFAVRVRRDGYRKNETHLVSLLKCEVIGNIHENPELLD